jgi:putative ABC transport system permease protein
LHRALIVAEMSLAVLLVLGAGLLVQSLVKLQGVDTGFDANGALTFRIGLPTSRYETQESWTDFATELRGELAQQPGVEAAGGVGLLPFFASQTTGLQIVGDPDSLLERVQFRHTTPGFLEAIGTAVLRGRSFDDGDIAGAAPVIILNQTAARRLFGDEDPIGHRVTTGWGHHPDALEVVGVVEDVRLTGLAAAPPPAMYWPYGQYDGRSTMAYVVRTAGDASSLVPMIRNVVADLDPELPIYAVELLADRNRRSVAQERFTTWLLAGFAGLAMALAAIGIFGVMAYGVVRRRREIGVRVAIGASPGEVTRAILFEGAALAGGGLAIGSLGALAMGRTFDHLLYETSATDPATFAGVGALLFAVALMACYVPARRAGRVDPMVVLRNE